jgi:hypothetical protein
MWWLYHRTAKRLRAEGQMEAFSDGTQMARWKVLGVVIGIGCGRSHGLPAEVILLADLTMEQFSFEKQKMEQWKLDRSGHTNSGFLLSHIRLRGTELRQAGAILQFASGVP